MRIGEVAEQADVTVDTIRFYERRGVLPSPERRPSGYRIFTASDVERIKMARQLQAMGFTLDEIIDSLRTHDRGGATCESERWRIEAVIDRIDGRIAELQRTRQTAVTVLDECRSGCCRFVSNHE